MQTAKSLISEPPVASLTRVAAHSAAAAARRAKRVAALDQLSPHLEQLSTAAKDGGLGLIGYFLDMAIFEVKREQEMLANKG